MPGVPPLPDDFPSELRPLVEEVDRCQQAFDALWPEVQERRRLYFVEASEAARADLDSAKLRAEKAQAELEAALATFYAASGIDLGDFDEAPEPIGDPFPRISRASVINETPVAAALVEDYLPQAIAMIRNRAPKGWFEREPVDLFRLSDKKNEAPISIVKGVRIESERSPGHRLRQTIMLAEDYLANDMRYDHFGGALAVTQLAQLGARADALAAVGGAEQRLKALFSGAATDAILMELLVAAACAAKGRNMLFVEATSQKSPDLRCVDSFNMVVECKRSSTLSDYEVVEEARMRDLFEYLRAGAAARGQYGRYEVELVVEATEMNASEIAATCLRQRFAPHPENPLAYPWGSVAFHALPARLDLSETTKAYSPILLDEVFGWDMEAPDWDGLICHIDTAPASVLDRVRAPIGLAWRVVAGPAIIKRSRAPVGLFSKAITQIPPGEFGLVYVAYMEGARSDVADNRTEAFLERIREWEHDAGIRVPAAFLVRQYPLPTGHGNPDVIESTVRLLSEQAGGGDWIFREYPSAIYTTKE